MNCNHIFTRSSSNCFVQKPDLIVNSLGVWQPDTGDAALLTGGYDGSRLSSIVLYPEGCSVPSMDARLKNNQHSEKNYTYYEKREIALSRLFVQSDVSSTYWCVR